MAHKSRNRGSLVRLPNRNIHERILLFARTEIIFDLHFKCETVRGEPIFLVQIIINSQLRRYQISLSQINWLLIDLLISPILCWKNHFGALICFKQRDPTVNISIWRSQQKTPRLRLLYATLSTLSTLSLNRA